MNNETIAKITAELDAALSGRKFGRIFVPSSLRLIIDFRLPEQRFLLLSTEPGSSRVHLVSRRMRDLERASGTPGGFVLGLRKRLSGATVTRVEKAPEDRVIKIILRNENEFGEEALFALVIQLTGRSSNAFILDSRGHILDRLRATAGDGQEVGEIYAPPERTAAQGVESADPFTGISVGAVSDAVDGFYLEKEVREAFESKVREARSKLSKEKSKRRSLVKKLEADLESHGDPETWKHKAEVLLANVSDAKRTAGGFTVKDFFSETVPDMFIEADEHESVTQAAERCFKRYAKARNARAQIAERMAALEKELADLEARSALLEAAAEDGDEGFFGETKKPKAAVAARKPKDSPKIPGVRIFTSSDGYSILVGKGSKDNDNLTFKVAKSYDTWLHAADYPGSHVVIRNNDKNSEVPMTTLLQAAQIAAFYSDARNQGKAAVNYTLKKFVNKPRGAAPGLVSLSGFKTVLVEPMVPDAISKD